MRVCCVYSHPESIVCESQSAIVSADSNLTVTPHDGAAICRMRRTRAAFKLALRYCKQHEDEIRADACANSIQSRCTKQFWRNVSKVYNSKASKYVNSIGDAVGD